MTHASSHARSLALPSLWSGAGGKRAVTCNDRKIVHVWWDALLQGSLTSEPDEEDLPSVGSATQGRPKRFRPARIACTSFAAFLDAYHRLAGAALCRSWRLNIGTATSLPTLIQTAAESVSKPLQVTGAFRNEFRLCDLSATSIGRSSRHRRTHAGPPRQRKSRTHHTPPAITPSLVEDQMRIAELILAR